MTQPMNRLNMTSFLAVTHFLLIWLPLESWFHPGKVTILQTIVMGRKNVKIIHARSHIYCLSCILILDRARLWPSWCSEVGSLCVSPAAINNRHYSNYQQPSPNRQDDDSFIITSLQYGPGFNDLQLAVSFQAVFFFKWMGWTLHLETLSWHTLILTGCFWFTKMLSSF